jgi:hypothetical protein
MNIDEVLQHPNGSIDNIRINLDTVPSQNRHTVFAQILEKITKTGIVTIVGLDIFSFAKSIVSGARSVEEANQILSTSQSMDTLDNAKRFLLQHNFKMESCKRDNGYYIFTARHSVQ